MSIKVAIVGTGWGTRIQVPAFRQAGLEIAALWARSADKARQVAGELDIPFSTADYEAVLARPEVDLVSIVTPPHLHAEMAVAALAAGKHVLAEKPTALNAAQAEQMLAAARAHPDRLALIDHELRFLPTRQRMRALIQDGYVGRVYHVEGASLGAMRLDPNRPWNWWSDAELGGGLLGALGSHFVDALTWLLDRPVRRVSGVLRTHVRQRPDAAGRLRPVTSDDYAHCHLDFGDGAGGALQLSAVAAGQPVHRLLVAGEAGSLHLENDRLTGYRLGADGPEDLTVDESIESPAGFPGGAFARGSLYLGRALRPALEAGDHAPLAEAATFADGLHIQRVLDAARRSDREQQWAAVASGP